MTIGRTIRDARKAEGMSQTLLAQKMGISLWTLCRVENGSRTFDRLWLDKMPPGVRSPVARALEVEYQRELDSLREGRVGV